MQGNMDGPGSRFVSIAAAGLLLAGCTTTTLSRLDVTFDNDTVGLAPATYPAPTPPNDVLASYSLTQTTSVVVADPAGGGWLRITPQASFVIAPDDRKRAIIVSSDAFTPGANIRGHLRLRIEGLGQLFLGLRAVNGQNMTDFLGGFGVSNHAAGTTSVELLNPFYLSGMEGSYPLFTSAGALASVPGGQLVDIHWSLDQASRSIAASVAGGPPKTTQFGATSNGIATTPIERLSLWVWLGQPSSNTTASIDNLYIEEYK